MLSNAMCCGVRRATVPVKTLIFDIDDTLYPVSSGFSDHRNGPVVCAFMMKYLGFDTEQEAMALRKEVFTKYHSTLKGLTMANEEGRLRRPFRKEDLSQWYVDNCDYKGFLRRDEACSLRVPSFLCRPDPNPLDRCSSPF